MLKNNGRRRQEKIKHGICKKLILILVNKLLDLKYYINSQKRY